jgi:uncharacterized phage protein (TIGR01671 family)
MRELKFRAINHETNKFVYGYLIKLQEGIRKFWAIIDDEFYRFYIHSEKTIGQYTGLKDINGKEIYEGDIVSYVEFYRPEIKIVKFGHFMSDNSDGEYSTQDQIGFYLEPIEKTNYPSYEFDSNKMEVIGNIHENKELLEDIK